MKSAEAGKPRHNPNPNLNPDCNVNPNDNQNPKFFDGSMLLQRGGPGPLFCNVAVISVGLCLVAVAVCVVCCLKGKSLRDRTAPAYQDGDVRERTV